MVAFPFLPFVLPFPFLSLLALILVLFEHIQITLIQVLQGSKSTRILVFQFSIKVQPAEILDVFR